MRILLLGLVAAVATAIVAPGAQAATRTYAVVVGDSVAAGAQNDGAGDLLLERRDAAREVFERARPRYSGLRLVRFGCPGDNTSTFQYGGCPFPGASSKAQLRRAMRFIGRNRERIAYVMLAIGGDNYGRCTAGDALDLACFEAHHEKIIADLPRIASSLRRAAGPRTRIVQLTLYNPFLAAFLRGQERVAWAANDLTKKLNRAIRAAGKRHRLRIADVYGEMGAGRLNETTTYEDQEVPVAVAKVCVYTQICTEPPRRSWLPEDRGYRRLAAAVIRALRL